MNSDTVYIFMSKTVIKNHEILTSINHNKTTKQNTKFQDLESYG